MPKIFQCIQQRGFILGQYSAMQSEHSLKIRSGYLNIQKSLARQSHTFKIWSLDLLYPMFLGLSSLFLNLNPML